MDSVSHIRVANLLMDYVEQTCGVTFDQSGFIYGNLKPDLTGTYLTKRHNPSIMMDEVMEKIRTFTRKYTIGRTNGRELSVDLGEICHYMTDFFTYPHNDDIYEHNLLAHYVYEKRVALVIRRRMTEDKFEKWASPIIPPTTVDTLVNRISTMHEAAWHQRRSAAYLHRYRYRGAVYHQHRLRAGRGYCSRYRVKLYKSKNRLYRRFSVFQAQKDESKRTRLLLFILRWTLRFQRIQRFLPRLLPGLPPPCPCGQSR